MAESCAVRKCYEKTMGCLDRFRHPFLLVIRLYWGFQFFQAGKGKFSHLDDVTGFFSTLHIPFPHFNSYLVASTECVGGLLLLLGLFARVAAIPLTISMMVAFSTAHSETLKTLFSDPEPFLSEDAFHFLMASVLVLIFGPGGFSLDAVLAKLTKFKKRDAKTD